MPFADLYICHCRLGSGRTRRISDNSHGRPHQVAARGAAAAADGSESLVQVLVRGSGQVSIGNNTTLYTHRRKPFYLYVAAFLVLFIFTVPIFISSFISWVCTCSARKTDIF